MEPITKAALANAALAAAFGAFNAKAYKMNWKKGAMYAGLAGLVLNATIIGGVTTGKRLMPKGYVGAVAGGVVGALAAPRYNQFLAEQTGLPTAPKVAALVTQADNAKGYFSASFSPIVSSRA